LSRGAALAGALTGTITGCTQPAIMLTKPPPDAAEVIDEPPIPDAAASKPPDLFNFGGFGDGGNEVAELERVYCPGSSAAPKPVSCAVMNVVVDPYYADKYTCYDLGPVPGVPALKYGGLTLTLDRCSTRLLIGGEANDPRGMIYAVDVVRDATGHIAGFSGMATVHAAGDRNDGGVSFGPGNVLFVSRYPSNQLQQTKPGSRLADKVIELTPLKIQYSTGSLNFVPADFPSAGAFKLVSWPGGQWYTIGIKPDLTGTYDIVSVKQELTLKGGPEGFVYVAAGSPLFAKNSLLVSEWSANEISTYETDENANPALTTRKTFITGLRGAEGAYRDPATGDFFFSTWGQQKDDRVVVVRGFAPIVIQ
jgi:hypothetical protein